MQFRKPFFVVRMKLQISRFSAAGHESNPSEIFKPIHAHPGLACGRRNAATAAWPIG